MDFGSVLDLTRHALSVALMVVLPILAVSLFVGVSVSVFQAVTQVQEMTLTFVPKMLAAAAVLSAGGAWMLTELVSFTRICFDLAAKVTNQ